MNPLTVRMEPERVFASVFSTIGFSPGTWLDRPPSGLARPPLFTVLGRTKTKRRAVCFIWFLEQLDERILDYYTMTLSNPSIRSKEPFHLAEEFFGLVVLPAYHLHWVDEIEKRGLIPITGYDADLSVIHQYLLDQSVSTGSQ